MFFCMIVTYIFVFWTVDQQNKQCDNVTFCFQKLKKIAQNLLMILVAYDIFFVCGFEKNMCFYFIYLAFYPAGIGTVKSCLTTENLN